VINELPLQEVMRKGRRDLCAPEGSALICIFVQCMTRMLLDCAMQCIMMTVAAISLSAQVGLKSNMGLKSKMG